MRSLFTFNSKSVPWAALTAIAFLAVLEVVLRSVPLPVDYPSVYFPRHEASKKFRTFKTLQGRGYDFNTVFLGSSVADMGFDAIEFNREMVKNNLKFLAFNFGINGAGPAFHEKLILYLLERNMNLRLIVYGISPIEVNSGSELFLDDQKKFLDGAYMSKFDYKIPFSWSLKKLIFEHSAIMKWREVLWTGFFDFDSWRMSPDFKLAGIGHQPITPEMHDGLTWADETLRRKTSATNYDRMTKLFSNFTPLGFNLEALERIIRYAKEKNIQLIVVNMPLVLDEAYLKDTSYTDIISSPTHNLVSESDQALTELLERQGVTFLNMRPDQTFGVHDFSDPLHLMASGAAKLSDAVAIEVLKLKTQ